MEGGADLTVAVLCRNRPDYLREMLRSLRLASDQPFDIAIRDHSDGDICARVVVDFANENPAWNVEHLHPEPRGQRENILGAVAGCSTEFLMIINDDDLCQPSFIDLLLAPLRSSSAIGFASGNVICVDRAAQEITRMRNLRFTETRRISLTSTLERARFHIVDRLLQPFMGTIFRTEVLRGLVLPVEAATLPDLWLSRHMVDQEVDGWCSNEIVFSYRVHGESVASEAKDLAGYRWSMMQFLDDEIFAPFRDALRNTLREYERMTFLGYFVSGDRSPGTVHEILERNSSGSALKQQIMRVALKRPFSALTCRYLAMVNPRFGETRNLKRSGQETGR